MSSKRKKDSSATACLGLPPQVFLSSLEKLNIRIHPQEKCSSQNEEEANDAVGGKDTPIYCSLEAMEFLRQSQSQFIALLSSELASGEDTKSKRKRKSSAEREDDNHDAIRTIMPQHIKPALQRLDFHNINIDPISESFGSAADQKDGRNKVQQSKKKRGQKAAKVKKKVNDSTMTEALMKEQEKLFAMSVVRAKEAEKGI
jgi:hypothetical protein